MTRIDWPIVLGEIAYLLGDLDPLNPERRVPCGERALADRLGTARSTLRGWLDGSEPKHADGERVIDVWCQLTLKSRTFAPLQRASFSAAQVR